MMRNPVYWPLVTVIALKNPLCSGLHFIQLCPCRCEGFAVGIISHFLSAKPGKSIPLTERKRSVGKQRSKMMRMCGEEISPVKN